ncbi:uncharacterized protein LOC133839311 [Drosophila sulfurigaster albostrigata]|uniref:uncharacterized protein LOC133839311 n=1 Tax=Drosophila sulfurigaster albostrigata TaxID=89887 RepID=UPI002D21C88D|nr:uncharacterized protein LOC133839311 [Drosophila sulfurigaster albostrigata]
MPNICILCSPAKRSYDLEILSADLTSSDEEKVNTSIQVNRISFSESVASARVNWNCDTDEKSTAKMLLWHCRNGRESDYTLTPYQIPNQKFDTFLDTYYHDLGPLSTVCIGRSTPYNIPQVTRWLFPYFYTKIRDRTIMMELRKTIFKDGRAIECHSSKYPEFRSYIDCALLRNMRLEFLILEYPKHQLIPDQYTEIN